MPTLEDEDKKLNGDHDKLDDMSAGENATADQLLADASSSDEESYAPKEKGGKSSKAAGVAGAIASKSPIGRIANFFSTNKRETAIGTTILISIIGVVSMIASIVAPAQMVWMNTIAQGFNYDPYNRSTTARAFALKDVWNQDRDTRMSRKKQAAAANPDQVDRISNTPPRDTSRLNRRFQHRFEIKSRIDTVRQRYAKPRFVWKVFEGKARSGWSRLTPRLRLQGVSTPDRNRVNVPLREGLNNNVEEIANESDPERRRSLARSAARRAGISTVQALSTTLCLGALVDDMIPEEDEMYELYLSYAANFNAAGSQLAAGQEVHGDEVSDAMSLYYDSIEVEDVDEEVTVDTDEQTEDGETITETNVYEADPDGAQVMNRDFSQSAAFKRTTNRPVTGSEEDIDLAYGMDLGMLSGTVSALKSVGGLANRFTGGNATTLCAAAGVLSVPLFIGEIILTVKTGGLIKAGVKVTFHAAMVAAMAHFFEMLSDGFVSPEGPVMQHAHADLGMNLSQSEMARNQGSVPVTSAEMNNMRTAHLQKQGEEDRQRGFVWRYLSPENPRSTLTTMAMTQDFGVKNILNSIATIPQKLPSLISGALFTRADANEDFDNYKIQQFGLTEFQLGIDVVENDEYVEFIDGEEFDLGGSGYSCTFESMDEITWNEQSDEEREANEALGNGEIMRSNYLVFYNFEGPPDPDDPSEEPTECNTRRWRDAVLMYELINQCMTPAYYQMLEERGWSFNHRWETPQVWMTPEQILDLPYIETNIANSDIRFLLPDNPAWERQFAWGTPFNARDEIRSDAFGGFGGKAFMCDDASFAESFEFEDSFGRDSNILEHWSRVGIWRLDNELVDNYICLSHDDPCANSFSSEGGGGNQTSGPPGDTVESGEGWTISSGEDYSGTPCPSGSNDHTDPNLTDGVYTHPTQNFRIRICRISGTDIPVASIWADQVKALLDAAEDDGRSLDGSGWRSYERQAELRISNGCPDVDSSPSSSCTVPTAIPGNSMHERGLAVDFRNCSTTSTSCFQWLDDNASQFSAYNFAPEPWHWSTNGR